MTFPASEPCEAGCDGVDGAADAAAEVGAADGGAADAEEPPLELHPVSRPTAAAIATTAEALRLV
jgi:hypothetical protein